MGARGQPKTGGRKKVTPNKEVHYLESEAKRAGMPRDYLINVLRDVTASQERRDWAAATLAPYVMPKLAAIETKVDQTTEVRVAHLQTVEGDKPSDPAASGDEDQPRPRPFCGQSLSDGLEGVNATFTPSSP